MSNMSNSRPVIGIAAWRQTVEVWESKMTIFQIDQAYVKRLLAADGGTISDPAYAIGDVDRCREAD